MNALLVASRSADQVKGGWSPIGRLEFDHGTYRFVYTKGARTAVGFTPFNGMEDLEEIYESNELLPIFANRLLSRSRPKYEAYLQWSGFDPANPRTSFRSRRTQRRANKLRGRCNGRPFPDCPAQT